jgi:nuclear pore complex protein Nup54
LLLEFHLGLTAFVWEQAKKENPKPQLLLPVPLIGVKALRDRMKSQFIEHEDQKQQLENIRQQLRTVKDQCDAFRLTMKRYQTNLLEYSHRILKATIQFECRRRQHEPKLTSTEIQIWTNLNSLQNLSQSPLDIRIKDLIMKIRMNPTLLAPIQWSFILNSNESLRFDKEKLEQIKDILQEIHRGIKNVVELVQNDRTILGKIDEKILQRK